MLNKRLINTPDIRESETLDARQLAAFGLRATVVVPLIAGEQVLGTLNVGCLTPAAYNSRDEHLLQQIAPPLASESA